MARLKRCLGVDLGSHAIKVADLVLERDGVRIHKLASAPLQLAPGISPAERQAAVAKTLRDLLRTNKISTKEAVFALPGQVAFVRRFRLPATTKERLERIIRYEARQQIPFPLDRTQLEYQIFPVPGEGEVEVLLVAVRTDHILDFVNLTRRTGLTAIYIAISPFALYNFHAAQTLSFGELLGNKKPKNKTKTAGKTKNKKSFLSLSFGKKSKKGADATGNSGEPSEDPEEETPAYEEVKGFVHIGASAIDLAIARVGHAISLGFTRSVPTAGNEITRTIQDKCRLESHTDAEKVKRHNTRVITFDFDPETTDEDYNITACEAATVVVDRLIADIRRSLDFYISQPDGMAVDTLVLSGAQAAMPGLAEYIEEKLGLPATRLTEFQADWLRVNPKTLSDEQVDPSLYAVAIGLAFQGMNLDRISVDFLPRESKIIRDFPYKRAAAMLALVVGTVGFASRAGTNYSAVFNRQTETIHSLMIQRREGDRRVQEAQSTREEAKANFVAVAPGLGKRNQMMEVLATIQKVKPPSVLIDTLVVEENGQVMIIAIGENRNLAAEFIRSLQAAVSEEAAEIPQLNQLDMVTYPGFDQQVVQFTIEFRLKLGRNRLIPQA